MVKERGDFGKKGAFFLEKSQDMYEQGWQTMQIKATLKPGQNGTKSLLERYGDQLICVRYRYDKSRKKRLTTVELIVDEQDWLLNTLIPPDRLVHIRIGYGETELREK